MGVIRKFDVVQGHGIMTQETQLWNSSEVENASQNLENKENRSNQSPNNNNNSSQIIQLFYETCGYIISKVYI